MIKGISDIIPKDSPNKLSPIYDTPYTIEPGSNRLTFQSGEVDYDIDNDIGPNCIMPIPMIHLSVIRCVPLGKNLQLFTRFTKIGNKNYKVIVGNGSCINVISSKAAEKS